MLHSHDFSQSLALVITPFYMHHPQHVCPFECQRHGDALVAQCMAASDTPMDRLQAQTRHWPALWSDTCNHCLTLQGRQIAKDSTPACI